MAYISALPEAIPLCVLSAQTSHPTRQPVTPASPSQDDLWEPTPLRPIVPSARTARETSWVAEGAA
jgi:hypothetical protein